MAPGKSDHAHDTHGKKDTSGMRTGKAGALDLDKRIQETYAKVTALPDVRSRLKAAVSDLLEDAKNLAQGNAHDQIAAVDALAANLDPHWLDMVIDGK